MDRTTFFSRKPATKTVSIEAAGGDTFTIRKLSEADVRTLQRDYTKPDKQLEGLRYAVRQAVVDEDGNRIFEDGDLAKLATVDFAIVKELAAEIVEFSGLQGVEDAAKKS